MRRGWVVGDAWPTVSGVPAEASEEHDAVLADDRISIRLGCCIQRRLLSPVAAKAVKPMASECPAGCARKQRLKSAPVSSGAINSISRCSRPSSVLNLYPSAGASKSIISLFIEILVDRRRASRRLRGDLPGSLCYSGESQRAEANGTGKRKQIEIGCEFD